MTEQRCNYTLKYFGFLLGKLRGSIILSLIFSIFGWPMINLSQGSIDERILSDVRPFLLALGVICVGGILVMSFLTPLIAMKHIYTKTSADNILSLPLTAWQRYICEVGAGIGTFLVPYLAVMPFALLTALEGRTTAMYIVITMLFMLMFSMFNIFIMSFCGRLAEAALYPVMFNILLPLFFMTALWLARSDVYGLEMGAAHSVFSSYSLLTLVLFGSTSPAGMFLYCAFMGGGQQAAILPALIFTAVFFVLGFIVYRNRPAHNIGQPFVYKKTFAVYSVILSAMCVEIFIYALQSTSVKGAFVGDNAPTFGILALLLFIMLLILELINYKKIHKVWKFLVKYAAVFAGGLLLSFMLLKSDGFGESYYIPPVNDTRIMMVSVSSYSRKSGVDTFLSRNSYVRDRYYDAIGIDLDPNSEIAEYIRSVQKNLIKTRPKEGTDTITIYYTLKNGSAVRRTYNCTLPADFTETLVTSKEYRLSPLTGLVLRLYSDEIAAEMEPYTVLRADIGYPVPDMVEVIPPYYGNTSPYFERKIDWDKMYNALYTDLSNDNDYGRHGDLAVCAIRLGRAETEWEYEDGIGYVEHTGMEYFTGDIKIYEGYVNTLSYLRSLGTIPTAEEAFVKKFAADSPVFALSRVSDGGTSQTVRPILQYIRGGYGYCTPDTVFVSLDEFRELIAHSGEYAYAENGKNVYCIQVGAPEYFHNFRGSHSYIAEWAARQLDESGVSQYEGFYRPDGDEHLYYEGNYGFFAVINESYADEVEKLMNDGRYVFSKAETSRSDDLIGISYQADVQPTYAVTTTAAAVG